MYIDRALEKLAKQKESVIGTSAKSSQKESGGRYSSSYNSTTSVSANTTVSAHIVETWRNPRNNRYYVLMEMD